MATSAQVKNYIDTMAPLIQKYAKKYGYKVASPIIAQACCESAYGTSLLASKHHNHWGMKCGSTWKGKSVNMATKEEYKPGTLTNIKANFRAYDSLEEGIKGYFEFISIARYANLFTAKTPEEYLQRIKDDGYATSSTYVQTNMNIVKTYNLTKYDNFNEPRVNTYPAPTRILKLTTPYMKGEDVKWLQFELGMDDEDIDGIFGPGTNKKYKTYLGF